MLNVHRIICHIRYWQRLFGDRDSGGADGSCEAYAHFSTSVVSRIRFGITRIVAPQKQHFLWNLFNALSTREHSLSVSLINGKHKLLTVSFVSSFSPFRHFSIVFCLFWYVFCAIRLFRWRFYVYQMALKIYLIVFAVKFMKRCGHFYANQT